MAIGPGRDPDRSQRCRFLVPGTWFLTPEKGRRLRIPSAECRARLSARSLSLGPLRHGRPGCRLRAERSGLVAQLVRARA